MAFFDSDSPPDLEVYSIQVGSKAVQTLFFMRMIENYIKVRSLTESWKMFRSLVGPAVKGCFQLTALESFPRARITLMISIFSLPSP